MEPVLSFLRDHSKGTEEKEEKDELEILKQRYLQLRKQRQLVAQARHECQRHKAEVVIPRVEAWRLHRQVAMETYQSMVTQQQSTTQYLQVATRWNVWNDCFFIWHHGPWATINGARLGGIPSKLPMTISHRNNNNHNESTILPSRRPLSMWSSVAPAPSDATASSSDHPNTNANKVPWPEINAALGHVVLLLKLLQDQCGWTVTHQLLPMASTSQIGIRRRVKSIFGGSTSELQPPVIHNLYFEESSFSLFKGGALRQFQVGLVALLECIVEINAQLQDKTIVLPHVIQLHEDATSTTTIGGVSIAFAETEDFTRACKYLLTNMKWLVAYTVKHHVER